VTSPFAVRTRALTKRYGSLEALAALTLDVPEGAVFALVGPNGAGKSTALKTMLNVIQPDSGSSEVLGVDSRRIGPAELAAIGYVSENQKLPGWMTTGYFLSYCKRFYPTWSDSDAAELVAQYALPLDRPLDKLSRGMRMKSALAASLAYRPKLIVLDEPFSGLDVLVREQLIETVLERTPEATVVIASHDLAEIESFASHAAYLEGGRLRFTEEMPALSERFRDVEVTLENPVELPRDWPPQWLNPEQSSVVIRFVDSAFSARRTEEEVLRRIPGVRGLTVRPMPLRSIFVALAKSAERKEAVS
jgi:ABC-2 type transport system ATP-binding protein